MPDKKTDDVAESVKCPGGVPMNRRSDRAIISVASIEGAVSILVAFAALVWFLISTSNGPQDKQIEHNTQSINSLQTQTTSIYAKLSEMTGVLKVIEERTRKDK